MRLRAHPSRNSSVAVELSLPQFASFLWVGQHFAAAGILRRLTLRDPTASAKPSTATPSSEDVAAVSFSDTGACSGHTEGRREPIKVPGHPEPAAWVLGLVRSNCLAALATLQVLLAQMLSVRPGIEPPI
jgi:hypothetical protein